MTSADEVVLGLFPLGLVLLPGEVVPLHIFEERYKRLVEERMDGGEFGIVLVEEGALRECGCRARVSELLEGLDDGSMNILVEGVRRFVFWSCAILPTLRPSTPGASSTTTTTSVSEAPTELSAGVLGAFRRMLVLMDVESPK